MRALRSCRTSARQDRYWVLALLVAQPVPTLAEPENYTLGTAPEVREFGDWSISCDNGKRCEAIGVSSERAKFIETEWGETGILVLRVTREAGPVARPRAFIDERLWDGQATDRHGVLALHVLYAAEHDRIGPAYRLLPLKGGLYEIDPRDVDAFLAESAKTDAVTTRMAKVASIGSTRGMIAALRYMDEAQGRRENVTAIYGKGSGPASRVPQSRLLPRVKIISGVAGRAGIQVPDDQLRRKGLLLCGVTAAPHTGVEYRLANGDRLWSISCDEENSDNANDSRLNPRSMWFFEHTGNRRSFPNFPRPEQGRMSLPNTLPNSSFDPVTGLLTATLFYGQNRDCGWQRRWGWDGALWQLVSGRELHGCMGVMPNGWLSIWRSRVR